MKKSEIIIFSFFLSLNIFAQNITNTLAPNGSFKIKDGTTDYFILNQSNGAITLPLQLAGNQQGSIFKGLNRFLHTYHGAGTDGFNTFLGINAGNFTMGGFFDMGSNNTGIGHGALFSITTGNYNSALGVNSLYSNSEGSQNSAFGVYSLYTNSTGVNNSAFGVYSLYTNSTGFRNSAFGVSSLRNNSTGFRNSAFGFASLSNNSTGNNNSAFGTNSLAINSSGNENSAFGDNSLVFNTAGNQNSAFGVNSLYSNSTGWHNTAVGYDALSNNAAGFQNTAIGHHSLLNNTGNYNTAIGYNSGSSVTTGYNLTLIGIDANPSSPSANDQITLGNQFVSSLRCNVQTITSLSDARDKKNIKDLTLGLDFITKLKPRQFNWDRREWYEGGTSDGSKIQGTLTAGFIAQEFDETQKSENAEWLNLVLKDNPDKWEATYGNLLPVMVKAIQELAIQNEQLRIEKDKEIAKLKEDNLILKSEMEIFSSIKEELSKIEILKEELIQQINELKSVQQEYENKFSSIEN